MSLFSDLRDDTLSGFGLGKDTRDALQPYVNQASPVISQAAAFVKPGQAVPATKQGLALSNVYTNDPADSTIGKILAPKIMGIPLVLIALAGVTAALIYRKV